MKNPRLVLALRIFAVIFSVALATTYVACQGGSNDNDAQDPPGEDPAVFPGSKSRAVTPVLPGSKSAPMDYNNGLFDPGDEEAKEPEPDKPAFLPGSKSLKVTPKFLPPSKSAGPTAPGFTTELLERLKGDKPSGDTPTPDNDTPEGPAE
jgi:hypothetical protein